jgi:hypothetical protein
MAGCLSRIRAAMFELSAFAEHPDPALEPHAFKDPSQRKREIP